MLGTENEGGDNTGSGETEMRFPSVLTLDSVRLVSENPLICRSVVVDYTIQRNNPSVN